MGVTEERLCELFSEGFVRVQGRQGGEASSGNSSSQKGDDRRTVSNLSS